MEQNAGRSNGPDLGSGPRPELLRGQSIGATLGSGLEMLEQVRGHYVAALQHCQELETALATVQEQSRAHYEVAYYLNLQLHRSTAIQQRLTALLQRLQTETTGPDHRSAVSDAELRACWDVSDADLADRVRDHLANPQLNHGMNHMQQLNHPEEHVNQAQKQVNQPEKQVNQTEKPMNQTEKPVAKPDAAGANAGREAVDHGSGGGKAETERAGAPPKRRRRAADEPNGADMEIDSDASSPPTERHTSASTAAPASSSTRQHQEPERSNPTKPEKPAAAPDKPASAKQEPASQTAKASSETAKESSGEKLQGSQLTRTDGPDRSPSPEFPMTMRCVCRMVQSGRSRSDCSVSAVTMSDDSKTVYAGGNGYVYIWQPTHPSSPDDPPTTLTTPLATLPTHTSLPPTPPLGTPREGSSGTPSASPMYIRTVKLVSGGQRLVVAGEHDEISVWTGGPDWRSERVLQARPGTLHYAVAATRDGGVCFAAESGGEIAVWDVRQRAVVQRLRGHDGGASCLDLSPDERYLVSGGLDSHVRVWDWRKSSTAMTGTVAGVTATANTPAVAPVSVPSLSPGRIPSASAVLGCAAASVGFGHRVFALAHCPKTAYVAIGDKYDVDVVDFEGENGPNPDPRMKLLGSHEGYVLTMKFAPGAKFLCTGGRDKTLQLWEPPPTGRLLCRARERNSVLCCDVARDARSVVAGCWGDGAAVWTVEPNTNA